MLGHSCSLNKASLWRSRLLLSEVGLNDSTVVPLIVNVPLLQAIPARSSVVTLVSFSETEYPAISEETS